LLNNRICNGVLIATCLSTLVRWIKYVLMLQITIAVIAIILGFFEYQLLTSYQQGDYISLEAAFADGEGVISLLQITGFASLLAFIASAILIIQWIYRANANVRQLGALNMHYTPAWSVGYYFIPIFNLWKPYLAMKEIFKASIAPSDWTDAKTTYILPLWWTLWIASNLLNQSIFRLSAQVIELPELMTLNMLSQISNALDIPLALVTLALIKTISELQRVVNTN